MVGGSPLVSLGYEGRTPAELVDQLVANSVTVLVDVRLNPISRKPGLSKTRLAQCLAEAGIGYVHLRALGNPRDNREAFRAGERASRTRFQGLLEADQGANALRHVAELLDDHTVALLCFERDHQACHRNMVAEELRRTVHELELLHV